MSYLSSPSRISDSSSRRHLGHEIDNEEDERPAISAPTTIAMKIPPSFSNPEIEPLPFAADDPWGAGQVDTSWKEVEVDPRLIDKKDKPVVFQSDEWGD